MEAVCPPKCRRAFYLTNTEALRGHNSINTVEQEQDKGEQIKFKSLYFNYCAV